MIAFLFHTGFFTFLFLGEKKHVGKWNVYVAKDIFFQLEPLERFHIAWYLILKTPEPITNLL